MVVIKPRAVRQHEVAFHLVKRKWAMRIDARELGLFLVLRQTRYPEPPRIFVWIFAGIIPPPLEWAREMRPYQLHGLDHGIHGVQVVPPNSILRFNAEQSSHISPIRQLRTWSGRTCA